MKEDLKIAKVLLVVVIVLFGMNIFVVKYDAISYYVRIESEGNSTVIIPIPNEQELIDKVMSGSRWVDIRIVESERGKGLEITLDSYEIIEAEIVTRIWSYDHDTDLVVGDDFLIHFEPIDDNASIGITEMRIIHESPLDFHSKQVFHVDQQIVHGWNEVEYELYTVTDGIV